MRNYIKGLTSFVFLFYSCKTAVPTCAITIDELLKGYADRVFKVNSEDPNSDFRDKGKDSIAGGYYEFYPNGRLKEYNFFVDSQKVIYKEQFDSLGYLMHQEGRPLIHKAAELIGDSLVVYFYFFTLNKRYSSIIISNDSDSVRLVLSHDSLFSNVQLARYVIHKLHKEQDINAYIKVEYQDECTGEKKNITDSVNLHYTPRK